MAANETIPTSIQTLTVLEAQALADRLLSMTSIFVGATLPVIGIGVALELGKLSAVAWLGRYGGKPALRAALVVLVAVLMGPNAIGAYGFLAKAHIGHAVDGDVAVAGRNADIEARLSVQAGVVADLDRRIAQIDTAVDEATSKGRTASAMALADQQRKTPGANWSPSAPARRRRLQGCRSRRLFDGERRKVEADLGPVKYLATLLGADGDTAMRWFVLIVALLLDPAAVLLLLAASSARR